MKKLRLQIPGMQSAHCQSRVSRAIEAVAGVRIEQMEPGLAWLEVENHESGSIAIESIKSIGYQVSLEGLEDDGPYSEDELRFETNLNCSACVAQIAHSLDKAQGICHWSVDTSSETKELVVHSEGITAQQVIDIVTSHGFSIVQRPAETSMKM